jgi:hypothetical protein
VTAIALLNSFAITIAPKVLVYVPHVLRACYELFTVAILKPGFSETKILFLRAQRDYYLRSQLAGANLKLPRNALARERNLFVEVSGNEH